MNRHSIQAISAAAPILAAGLFCLFALIRYAYSEDDRRTHLIMAASLATLPAEMLAFQFVKWISEATPTKYDAAIFRLDALIGQPSFIAGKFLNQHPSLMLVSAVVYMLMAISMLAVFVAYVLLREKEVAIATKALLLNLFLALPIYAVFPVVGPAFAFRGYPDSFTISERITGLSNCIPSVHFSTAILVLFFAWRWPLGRALGIFNLAFTALATLGLGLHYAFDLVLAIPYAALCYRLALVPRLRPADVSNLEVVRSRSASQADRGNIEVQSLP